MKRSYAAWFIVACATGFASVRGLEAARAAPPQIRTRVHAPRMQPVAVDPVGSTVTLVRSDGRRLVVVADADDAALVLADADTLAIRSRVPLDGTPAQVLASREGWLFVALRDRARVAVLETQLEGALTQMASLRTDEEPFGLAETPDGRLLVTCAAAHVLDVFDVPSLSLSHRIDLPREPRAVVVSANYRRAYVAHLTEPLLSVVDLASPERGYATFGPVAAGLDRTASAAVQGYALASAGGSVLLPYARTVAGDARVRTRSGYGADGDSAPPAVVGSAAVVDDAATPRVYRAPTSTCLLPRAAAWTRGGKYLIACADRDYVESIGAGAPRVEIPRRVSGWVKKLMAPTDADSVPVRAAPLIWRVGEGVTGVAYDPSDDWAFAWAQGVRTLVAFAVTPPDGRAQSTYTSIVPVGPARAIDPEVARGRAIFHRSETWGAISRDGRACASCHPDGLDDGVTWPTPDGPRQTPALRGRVAGTAPYGWLGRRATLSEHLHQTIARLGGAGLSDTETRALVAYVSAMRAPAAATLGEDARVRRGREMFAQACAACHDPGGGFTDGQRHDVGSRARGDVVAAFDTPSLLHVGSTAPYFHDGRYPDIHALLVASLGDMWQPPEGLRAEDLDALEAYLRTL
jgi:mono/diheme cytochrome c family protein